MTGPFGGSVRYWSYFVASASRYCCRFDRLDDLGAAVGPDPPQPGPVVVVAVEHHPCWPRQPDLRRTFVVDFGPVDRRQDLLPDEGEVTGTMRAGGPRRRGDARLGRPTCAHGRSLGRVASAEPRRRRADPIPTRGTWRCSPSDQARPYALAGTNVRLPACLVSFPALPSSTAGAGARQAMVLIPKATVKPSTVIRPVAGPLYSYVGIIVSVSMVSKAPAAKALTSATVPPLASPNRV